MLAFGVVRKDALEVAVSAEGDATAGGSYATTGKCDDLPTTESAENDAAVKAVCEHWPSQLGDFSEEFKDAEWFHKDVLGKDGYVQQAKKFLSELKKRQNFCWPKFTDRPHEVGCPDKMSGNTREVEAGTYSGVVPTPERSAASLGRNLCWKDCRDVCGTSDKESAKSVGHYCVCADDIGDDQTGGSSALHADLYSRTAPAEVTHGACPAGTKSESEWKWSKSECRASCSGEFKHACGMACARDLGGCVDAMEERVENVLSGILETTTSVLKVMGDAPHAALGQAINFGVVQTFEVLRVVSKEVLAQIAAAEKGGAKPRSKKLVEAVLVALLVDLDHHATDVKKMTATAEHYVAAVVSAAKGHDDPPGTAAAMAVKHRMGLLDGPEKILAAFYAPHCTA